MLLEVPFLDDTQIEPKCPHFGVCGGCRLQNLPYSTQLEIKEQAVSQWLEPLGISPKPIIGCDEQWEWRNKMEFTFSQNKEGDRFLGLLQRGKRGRVESLKECHIAPSWMTEVLNRVSEWWERSGLTAYFPLGNRGLLRTLTLREAFFTGERLALLTVSGQEKDFLEPHLEGFIQALGTIQSANIRYQFVQKGTPTRFETLTISGRPVIQESLQNDKRNQLLFDIDATAFFQPNSRQAERIYELLVEAGQFDGSERVLDLFCGTGTIALFCAPHVQEVIGVELNPEAIENAKKNAHLNGIKNASFLAQDVDQFLKENEIHSDCVIVDPPRSGLTKKTIDALLNVSPKRILYLSCNPKSQAKDLSGFLERGYRVELCQPIDQFPQTLHIENLVALAK